ncbi:MAG TPA: SDR family NAD(P)-dependent oxidoreductase [Nitrospiraceae bacterium]|nr:SDR family NAD(P)-dependent oxidoreductase [Nitrospiraceae bacterium]
MSRTSMSDIPRSARQPLSGTALVTGASRGIGRAIGLEFGRAGWTVGVHYHQRVPEAEDTVREITRTGGHATAYQADVRHGRQVDAMVEHYYAAWRRIDVLVCNAGISRSSLLLRLDATEWEEVLATNLTGTFHCIRAAGAAMAKQGDGSIIVIGSYSGLRGQAGQAAYSASKAGLLGLAKTAAHELASHHIRVNVVLPGWQATELSGSAMPAPDDLSDHVLQRTADLGEVARTVVHLATVRGVSGQVWNLDSRPL